MVTSHIDTRKRILDAALVVAAREGFSSATTKRIAKNANVSEGIIYHYFKSKQELYLELIQTHADRFRSLLQKETGAYPTAAEKLQKLVAFHFHFYLTDTTIFKFIFGKSWSSPDMMSFLVKTAITPYVEFIAGIIRLGISRGEFKNVDPQTAAASLVGMMQLNILRLTFGKAQADEADLSRTVKELFLSGIVRAR